jgi:hypothetical protein
VLVEFCPAPGDVWRRRTTIEREVTSDPNILFFVAIKWFYKIRIGDILLF